MDIVELFHRFKADARLRYPLLLACISGTAYGFYYYEWQLRTSPVYLWPLIPDSPFFTMMFVLVLAAYSAGRRSDMFDTFTFIGLNKVGIWTLFVLLFDFDYYFSPGTWVFRSVLVMLHIGMVLCSFTLLRELERPDARRMFMLLGLFLASDYFDYIVGTHPILHTSRIDIVGLIAFTLTLACWGALWLVKGKSSNSR